MRCTRISSADAHSLVHCLWYLSIACRRLFSTKQRLLVVAEEDLDGQPAIFADLEALRKRVNLLDLLVSQLPAIHLEVALDTRSGDGLGNDGRTALQTPHEQDLLDALALVVGELLELLVLVQRRVGGAEAGVGSRVDALLLAVVEELGTAKCKPLELDPR
jgi:hypothetical protein